MYKKSLALAFGLAALLSSPVQADEVWFADFDKAQEVAKKEGKDLLVDFTGSDWCVWCHRLHDEVFGFDEFITEVQKHYVLVALDFPKDEEIQAKVPNPERNEELKGKYGVRGYPTVLLMTGEGEVYATTGYQEGGVEPYLEYLEKQRTTSRRYLTEVPELVKKFEATEGDARFGISEKAIAIFANLTGRSPFVEPLTALVRWPLEADADNARGMKMKSIKALLTIGITDDDVTAAGRELDPKNKQGVLEMIVQAQFQQVRSDEMLKEALIALDELSPLGFQDKEIAFFLNLQAAAWTHRHLEDSELAMKYAKTAVKIGTDDKSSLEFLNGLIKEVEGGEGEEEGEHGEDGEEGEHGDEEGHGGEHGGEGGK